jgi:hypothetical protein
VGRLCQGTIISRSSSCPTARVGLRDGRLAPRGNMSAEEIADWTAASAQKP